MQQRINDILNANLTKKAKIILLLELGLTRTQIADLQVLGKYGAIQNVYAAWKQGENSTPRPTRQPLATPQAFTPNGFNRRFGIEIEAYGVDRDALATALRRAGIDCAVEAYNHATRTHWKITTDNSITGVANPFEIVSPILEGMDGLEQVRKVSEVLISLRAKINRTCGMHIHFDAAHMNVNCWKNVMLNYALLENIIDSMMPESRRGTSNQYCRSLRIPNFATKFKNVRTIEGLSNLFPDRYYKVNMKAYVQHRTIEFRQHSGTIEFEKIKNWVLFLHNLLSYSTTMQMQSIDFEQLKKFNQNEIVNFYYNRINDLAA